MSPSSLFARLVRAGSIGVWVTFGSVAAHVFGEGSLPSMVALLPVVAAASAATWWVSRCRITLALALTLLAIPQVAVHLLSSYVHGHVMMPSMSMLVAHVLSTAVTGVVIAHAERVWWSLWEAWRERWTPIVVITSLVTVPLPALAGIAMPNPVELRHLVSRRGPPTS